ncbi:MAG: phosphatidate cytidylyltransferase [Clostridia bacterium]|nr:phosphatidate cytidylyltransferase [Clostridia bacterium]
MSQQNEIQNSEIQPRKRLVSKNRIIVGVLIAIFYFAIIIFSHLTREHFAFIGSITDGRAIVSTMLSVVIILAIIEMRRAIGFEKIPHSMSWIVWAYAIAFGPSYYLFGYTGIIFMSLFVFAVASFNAIMLNRPEIIMHVAFLLVYPGFLLSSLLYINKCASTQIISPDSPVYPYLTTDLWAQIHPSKTTYLLPYNSVGLAFVFVVSSFTDSFAMIFGKLFGKRKLCPLVSPKKTVEGAIGGLFGGLLGSLVVFLAYEVLAPNVAIIQQVIGLVLSFQGLRPSYLVLVYVSIGLVGSFMTQVGDLLASITKRHFGIKDYSRILGDHGGIMDRFDGIMLNATFVALVYMFII